MQTSENRVMAANDAAKRVGLSASTLAKLRLKGAGPAFSKLGRRVVYRQQDLTNGF
jgi:predicted DNA-binding transcriptional regulator AlpA